MSASWIKKLNESDSRLHKEDVIRQALEAATLGSTNAQMFLGFTKACYNPYVTFGIKKIPETIGIEDAENPWEDFNELLVQLSQRRLTGHAARDAVAEISERFDSNEWNTFCKAVLGKDLRAGISDKTVNKICKKTDYEIPIFGCQLATNSEGRPEMKGVKRLEPKLDGVRVIMMVQIQDVDTVFVTSFSRNGKHFDNFGHIEQQIKDNVAHYYKLPREFKMRPYIEHMPNVELLDSLSVDLDLSEGHDQLNRYAKDMVNLGYEGIMIKDVQSPYECKRNTFWMKWKPTITVDLTVIALEQGTGRNSDRLGALVCEGEDDGKYITVNVGSGFSDEDRDDYWANQSLIIGRTAEILCDAVTQNQDGSYSLRFPRFVRFRDDK